MRFAVRSPEALVAELDSSTGLLSYLHRTSADFESDLLPAVLDVARFVQSLPAHPGHHRHAGGLLHHCVQSALYALRLCEGSVFGGELPTEQRRIVEHDSRRAAFLASLTSSLLLPFRYLVVTAADGQIWTEFADPPSLFAWAAQHGGEYDVSWRDRPGEHHREIALLLAGGMLTPYWGRMRSDVRLDALSATAPEDKPGGHENLLQKVTRQALQKSIEHGARTVNSCFETQPVQVQDASQLEANLAVLAPTASETAANEQSAPSANASESGEAVDAPAPQTATPQATSADALKQAEMDIANELDILPGLPASVRELIEALRDRIASDAAVRKRVFMDGEQLVVDRTLLEQFGMSATAAIANLRKARAIAGANGRAVSFVREISQVLLPDEAQGEDGG